MLSPSSALPPRSPYIHKLCCLFEQNTDVFPYRFTRTGVPQRDTTVPTAWLQMPDTPLAMPLPRSCCGRGHGALLAGQGELCGTDARPEREL